MSIKIKRKLNISESYLIEEDAPQQLQEARDPETIANEMNSITQFINTYVKPVEDAIKQINAQVIEKELPIVYGVPACKRTLDADLKVMTQDGSTFAGFSQFLQHLEQRIDIIKKEAEVAKNNNAAPKAAEQQAVETNQNNQQQAVEPAAQPVDSSTAQ